MAIVSVSTVSICVSGCAYFLFIIFFFFFFFFFFRLLKINVIRERIILDCF